MGFFLNKKIYLALFFIIITIIGLLVYKLPTKIMRAELWSLKFPAQIEMDFNKEIKKELEKSPQIEGTDEGSYWFLLKVVAGRQINYYKLNSAHKLYDWENEVMLKTTPKLQEILQKYIDHLDKNNPFGVLVPWEEANKIFPRMSKAKLRDLETGMTLNIQRRAGSSHADVQPLKASDTATLKEIYGGKWSWKRRAVILEKDGYKIAASMNGMPHGQGAIYGNNFPGHFCIHFLDSETHSGNLDLAHQLMVRKSAGLVEQYLAQLTAIEMVEAALTAIAQNDIQLALLSFNLDYDIVPILKYMDNIAGLKIHSIAKEPVTNNFQVEIHWYELTNGKNYKEKLIIEALNVDGRFLLNPQSLVKLFSAKI